MDHWDSIKDIQLDFNGKSIDEVITKVQSMTTVELDRAIAALNEATKKLTKQEQLAANIIEIAKIVTTILTV